MDRGTAGSSGELTVLLGEYRCADCSAETEQLVWSAAAVRPLECDQCGSSRLERKLAASAVADSDPDQEQALDPKYRQMVDDAWRETSYADPMKYLEKMIPFDAVDDPGELIDI